MNSSSARRTHGKHRKQTPNKGRVALVALTTGAVTTGGASVATAANNDRLADAQTAFDGIAPAEEAAPQEAPQILAISEYKPVDNLSEQLGKAVEFAQERKAADEAARTPKSMKPAEGTFTSGFGMRWGAMHNGIDVANPVGTPIHSVMDGTVINSGPAQGFGNWIRIQHVDGSISVYGHMPANSLRVNVGDHVSAGDHIADIGSEGRSTGPHLHFEIHPGGGAAVDPVGWFDERGISV